MSKLYDFLSTVKEGAKFIVESKTELIPLLWLEEDNRLVPVRIPVTPGTKPILRLVLASVLSANQKNEFIFVTESWVRRQSVNEPVILPSTLPLDDREECISIIYVKNRELIEYHQASIHPVTRKVGAFEKADSPLVKIVPVEW